MKPSEYYYKKYKKYLTLPNFVRENKLVKELDNKFIDREELKKKIKNYKMKKIKMELEEFKKEILELLK